MRRSGLAVAVVSLAAFGLWWLARDPADRSSHVPAAPADGTSRNAVRRTELRTAEAPAEPEESRESVTSPDVPESGLVIEGRVFECAAGADPSEGGPAGGVLVRLADEIGDRVVSALQDIGYAGESASEEPGISVRSADDGTFRFVLADDGKRPRRMTLSVAEDDHAGAPSTGCTVLEGELRRTGLRLVRFVHGTLAGRTIDVEGRPVAEVEVELRAWSQESNSIERQALAVSDEEGRFAFEKVREVEDVQATKPGYTLLEGKKPRRAPLCTWPPLELVLAPEGALRVRVTDASGDPLPDLQVVTFIASPERVAELGWSDSLRKVHFARTDASGLALVRGVWAGQRLLVCIQREGRNVSEGFALDPIERADGERAVFGEEGGAPIVLAPGEERELVVELAVRMKIAGIVRTAAGAPHPEPWITLRSLDRPAGALDALERELQGAADGTFELELMSGRPLGRVLLEAADMEKSDWHGWYSEAKQGASRVLDLAGRKTGVEEVTLVLEPRRAITGRVVGESAGRVSLRLTPSAGSLLELAPTGSRMTESTRKDGEFRLGGLLPGRYDLEVSPNPPYPVVRVRGIEAGTEGLRIPLEGRKSVRVTVEVALTGGELGEAIVLHGRTRPHAESPSVPELPTSASYRELEGWPPAMLSLWSGAGNATDELGPTFFVLSEMKENPTTLELDDGLMWIGAKAKAKDGNYSFPIGTGLVHVAPGEYRLRFELTPSGSIEGRVRGAPAGRELFVALARGGELLALDVRQREMRSLCPLGADGYFRFPLVPVGALELRVGTREELASGRWTKREELRLERGAKLAVDVKL